MQSLFGFVSAGADLEIALGGDENRKMVESKGVSHPLFLDGDSVSGRVKVRLKDSRKLEHQGIKVEFVGQIRTPLLTSRAVL